MNCQAVHLDYQESVFDSIFFLSLALLLASLVLLVFCIYKVNSWHSVIWKEFRRLGKPNVEELKKVVIERLVDVHQKLEYGNDENHPHINERDTGLSEELLGYSWKLGLYTVVVSSFYFYMFFYVIVELKFIISFQPRSSMATHDNSFNTMFLLFAVSEEYHTKQNHPLSELYFNNSAFDTSGNQIAYYHQLLYESQQFYLDNELKNILTSDTMNLIFPQNGAYEIGIYDLLNDILLISQSLNENSTKSDYNYLRQKISLFADLNQIVTTEIFYNLGTIFNAKMIEIIFYSSIYAIIALVMFSWLFNYSINKHINKLDKIQKLGEFIPVKNPKQGLF